MSPRVTPDGTAFSVWSAGSSSIHLCLFDDSGTIELDRLPMQREGNLHKLFAPGIGDGKRYGLRVESEGSWFDTAKLLLDPYATEIDRAFAYDPRLAERGFDTAALMPKGIVRAPLPAFSPEPPRFTPGELIYEIPVRAFTVLHPEVPPEQRGTIAALAHPAIIAHLRKIGVSAVELMPVTAWIDERHLPPLGLTNGWGYNPVTYHALDPRLAPGGWPELRATIAALRAADIAMFIDCVYNHTGESDAFGPTLSLRGIDSDAYYRHDEHGLINDTGCGNSVDCNHPAARALILDSLRRFVSVGVDGFRFDLGPALGRLPTGFDANAPLITEMMEDPAIGSRILITEPWDIGPGGYQLGKFPAQFLEWNDAYRDDVRRFWRGDSGMRGKLATRLAGSSDVFGGSDHTRTVNFIAAHDGFTLADLVAHEHRHNLANGEDNRDGHGENLSWNNGIEGASDDPAIIAKRAKDVRALLATLFASRGTIMLTAGDEFGRTQDGNNNSYAQDNAIMWLDWAGRDVALEDFVAALATLRANNPALSATGWLTPESVEWLRADGSPMTDEDWSAAEQALTMVLGDMTITFDPSPEVRQVDFTLAPTTVE